MPRAPASLPRDALRPDVSIGLVVSGDFDLDILAQHSALFAIEREAVHHRQRVRRNRRTEPLDHVAIVVVVRRLDQYQ